MKTYTCFCRQTDNTGTTWIDTVIVPEYFRIAAVKKLASLRCSEDWQCPVDEIVCIGVIEGNPTLLFWQDIGET